MTRINVVPVSELVDEHLRGEWKEISRIFTGARKPKRNEPWPDTYRMGTGHMKFFFSRLGWLENRYRELWREMIRRGFKADFGMMSCIIASAARRLDAWHWDDYLPTDEAMAINRQRISDRLKGK